MPSFKPLSMFKARLMRTGTFLFVNIGSPIAASVGAKIAPVHKANPISSCGKIKNARIPPTTMISGKASPSNRIGNPGSY